MSTRRKRRRERQRRHEERKPQVSWARPGELREVHDAERLAYSRKQAAEALGVSISTIDRRVVPAVSTVKTPWGQRLIPIAELERFVREHLELAREHADRRRAGRPPTVPQTVVDRILQEHAHGRSLGEIATTLTADGVPTAHSGRRWWPSTVRAILVRAANGSERSLAESGSGAR